MSGTSRPAAALPSQAPAIFSPGIDLLCVGGLSLLVIVPLLLFGPAELGFVSIGTLAWMQLLVNMSHFMASYRIVYRDREMIRRHPWAAFWVPLILLGLAALALLEAGNPVVPGVPVLLIGFFVVSSAYLAWHYTGQVWGMMASYSFLAGVRFDGMERSLIRGSLRVLLAWHVAWFLNFWISNTPAFADLALADLTAGLYRVATLVTPLALVLGASGIIRVRLRTGRFPPLRALVAWVAIFVWYAAILRWGLPAFFLVQLAHAVQYLEFPARVELNRVSRVQASRAALHMAGYAGALLLASFLVTLIVPGPAMGVAADLLGVDVGRVAPVLILYFINIHHYFTDGVVWKLSNPEVRRELFSHVMPDAGQRPAAAPASDPVSLKAVALGQSGKTAPTAKPRKRARG